MRSHPLRPGGATAGLCLAVLLSAHPAAAQNRPPAYPTQDAAVTYAGMPGQALHVAWLAAAHRFRSDLAPGIWSLHDETANTTVVIDDTHKRTLAMPAFGSMQFGLARDARYTRTGTDSVAGTACTVWKVEAAEASTEACITADGIPLRLDAMGLTMTATAVSLAPQDPARFEVPKGYTRDGGP